MLSTDFKKKMSYYIYTYLHFILCKIIKVSLTFNVYQQTTIFYLQYNHLLTLNQIVFEMYNFLRNAVILISLYYLCLKHTKEKKILYPSSSFCFSGSPTSLIELHLTKLFCVVILDYIQLNNRFTD